MHVRFVILVKPLSGHLCLYLFFHVSDGFPLHFIGVVKSVESEGLFVGGVVRYFNCLVLPGKIIDLNQTEGELLQRMSDILKIWGFSIHDVDSL